MSQACSDPHAYPLQAWVNRQSGEPMRTKYGSSYLLPVARASARVLLLMTAPARCLIVIGAATIILGIMCLGLMPYGISVVPATASGYVAYVSNTGNGTVSLIATDTGQVLATIGGFASPGTPPFAVAANANAKQVYLASSSTVYRMGP